MTINEQHSYAEAIMDADTICAPATAPGGAIAVVRVSGPRAIDVAASVCRDRAGKKQQASLLTAPSHTVHFCTIVEQETLIDEVLVTLFRTPHSYTGEDSVEISCHGSRYIVQRILDLLVQHGCRMANPGEFTQRAFVNGKMDLSQAEAVADLIASSSAASHRMAMSQLRGDFSRELSQLREQLLHLTTLLELELDFSEEDVEFADRAELLSVATRIETHITRLTESFKTGQAVKQGIPVAIVGKTNVGKSTLLNCLLHDERAIVSDIHGTTRDTIEEVTTMQGVQFRFIDTAGLRQTDDSIEQIGINRTYQAIRQAAIVLWVIDRQPETEEIATMREQTEGKSVVTVFNKMDLHASADGDGFSLSSCSDAVRSFSTVVPISAQFGTNLPVLEQTIYEQTHLPSLSDTDIVVTNLRHYEALTRALADIRSVIAALNSGIPGDLIAQDLRQCLHHLAVITGGEITSDEVLGSVFRNFCVGK